MRFKHVLFALFTVSLLGFTGVEDDKDKKGIEWLEFDKAVQKGIAEKKMIVVDFYTDWCKWCKVMDKETYGNAEVIEFARKRTIMSKVNAESDTKTMYRGKEYSYRQLTMGFGIEGFPATVFLAPNGDFITAVSGYIKPQQFMPILEFLDGKHYESMSFEKYMEKRDKSSP